MHQHPAEWPGHVRRARIRRRLLAGLATLLLSVTVPLHGAEDREQIAAAERKLAILLAEREKHRRNIAAMHAEIAAAKRERREPDASVLADHYATATGDRTAAYDRADPLIQEAIDEFEDNFARNAVQSSVLAGGAARPLTRIIVEITRSNQFIELHLNPRIADLETEIAALKNPYLEDDMRDMLAESEAEDAATVADHAGALDAIQAATDALRARVSDLEQEANQVSSALYRLDRDIERHDEALDRLRVQARAGLDFLRDYGEQIAAAEKSAGKALRQAHSAIEDYNALHRRVTATFKSPALPPVCSAEQPSAESIATLRVLKDKVSAQVREFSLVRRQLAETASTLARAREDVSASHAGWLAAVAPLKESDTFASAAARQTSLSASRAAVLERAVRVGGRARPLLGEVLALVKRLEALGGAGAMDAGNRARQESLGTTLARLRDTVELAKAVGDREIEEPNTLATDIASGAGRYEALAGLAQELAAAQTRVNETPTDFSDIYDRAGAREEALARCLARLESGGTGALAREDVDDGSCAAEAMANARKELAALETAVSGLPSAGPQGPGDRAGVERLLDARKTIENRFLDFCQLADRGKREGFGPGTRAQLKQPAAELDRAWQMLKQEWETVKTGNSSGGAVGYAELKARQSRRAPEVESQRQRTEAAVRAAGNAMTRQPVASCGPADRGAMARLSDQYDALARRILAYDNGDMNSLTDVAEPYYQDGRTKYRQAITCLKLIVDGTSPGDNDGSPANATTAAATPAADCSVPKRPQIVDGQPTCPCKWKGRDTMVYHPPTKLCQTKLFASMYKGSMKLKKSLDGTGSMGRTVTPPVEYKGSSDLPEL